jgi:hypothetical protein
MGITSFSVTPTVDFSAMVRFISPSDGAPLSIQSRTSAISAAVSFSPVGGIAPETTFSTSKLFSEDPTTMARPDFPPARIAGLV